MDNYIELVREIMRNPGAKMDLISKAELVLNLELPQDYVQFLRYSNGGEGVIGTSAYTILWPVEDLASLNLSYEVAKYVPGLLLFGSDGGGEAYGFDTRKPQWEIVQVPFVGMEWQLAKSLGNAFHAFLERLSRIK